MKRLRLRAVHGMSSVADSLQKLGKVFFVAKSAEGVGQASLLTLNRFSAKPTPVDNY